jgi:hypothetical protein
MRSGIVELEWRRRQALNTIACARRIQQTGRTIEFFAGAEKWTGLLCGRRRL